MVCIYNYFTVVFRILMRLIYNLQFKMRRLTRPSFKQIILKIPKLKCNIWGQTQPSTKKHYSQKSGAGHFVRKQTKRFLLFTNLCWIRVSPIHY